MKTELLSDIFTSIKQTIQSRKNLSCSYTIKCRFINICVLSTLLDISNFWKSFSLPYRRFISFYIISFSFSCVQRQFITLLQYSYNEFMGFLSFYVWQKFLNVTATQGNLLSVCIEYESAFRYKRMGVINVLAIAPGRAWLL